MEGMLESVVCIACIYAIHTTTNGMRANIC